MDSVSPQTQNIHSFRKRLMFHVIMFEIKLFRVIWLFCCSKSFLSALYYIELPYNIKIHLVNIPTSQMYSPIIKKGELFWVNIRRETIESYTIYLLVYLFEAWKILSMYIALKWNIQLTYPIIHMPHNNKNWIELLKIHKTGNRW